MSTKKAGIIILVITATALCITSCYKVTTLVKDNAPAVTATVSLSKDLVPVLSKNCAISGCHNAGGIKPDLSTSAAYNSIVNGNFVSLSDPANSEIYLWLTGKRAVIMPVGAANNPSNINQLMLAWIKQGAKNN